MKKILLVVLVSVLSFSASAQVTPNLHLNLPTYGTPNWNVLLNQNFSILDSYLSGMTPLNISITGNAGTATALQNTPTFCSLPQVATGINVYGNAYCTEPSNITGNAATASFATTASASNHVPTQCPTGQFSTGDSTTWAANCAQVQYSQIGGAPAIPSTIYYQSIQTNTTPLTPQRNNLNFSTAFNVTDDPGNVSTDVDLAPSGVAPGTYCQATVNAQGIVTSGIPCGGITGDQYASGSCVTTPSVVNCVATITWGVAYGDANYYVVCMPEVLIGIDDNVPSAATADGPIFSLLSQVASGITVSVYNGDAGTNLNVISCSAHHP